MLRDKSNLPFDDPCSGIVRLVSLHHLQTKFCRMLIPELSGSLEEYACLETWAIFFLSLM